MHDYFIALEPYLFPGFVAFLLTFVATSLGLYLFPKWGLLDRPHLYGLKRAPIPYSGGLILFAIFLVCVGLFLDLNKQLWGVLLAASMIVGVSFWDDRKRLSPFFRLSVQLLAALTVVLSGIGVDAITNPLGGLIHLDTYQLPIEWKDTVYQVTILADLFTIAWIILLMNTVNWLDGLPGLVSGITGIGSVVIFILSIRPDFHYIDQTDVALLSVILAGITLAFWWFDFSPPKILMGDTGTMFLGFMLAVLSIFSGGKIATAFLIMGFPILDAFWVIGRRIWKGQSPFKGDLFHFHHRLLWAGFTERQAILTIYTICAIFGGIALFLGSKEKLVAIVIMVVLMILLGTLVVLRGRKRVL
jgi:UDP-GlcNAc:undecaprenyl-phosphate GlcNAc-1-phosphate transferase